jgi:hypothetical protein
VAFDDFLLFYVSIGRVFVGFGDEFDVCLTPSFVGGAGDSLLLADDVYSG